MFWYVAHVKNGFATKLVSILNGQENIVAFIPKKEKWFRGRENGSSYYTVELYPDYVFIKSNLNKEKFKEVFEVFFKTISGLVELLNYDDVYPMSRSEQDLFEQLFDGCHVIKRTLGKRVDSRFSPLSGPLRGLEDKIMKVNRHDHCAFLNFEILNNKMILAIEEVANI